MKKLYFLMIAVLISVSSFAQAPTAYALKVVNHTSCYQYFTVYGTKDCENSCMLVFESPMIAIAPGAAVGYPDSTFLGGTFPANNPVGIVLTRIVNQPPPFSCPVYGGTIGQPACGTPLDIAYDNYYANCNFCTFTRARWTPAINCPDTALLEFFS